MYEYQEYLQRYYPHMMRVEPVTYPKIYYVVFPLIQKKCMMMDNMNNPMMRPYPSYEAVEKASEEICDECLRQDPDLLKEYEIKADHETAQYFGPRRIFRDLVGILFLRELLRRRRHPYPYPYYPPVFGPGFGPGFGYYDGYGGY